MFGMLKTLQLNACNNTVPHLVGLKSLIAGQYKGNSDQCYHGFDPYRKKLLGLKNKAKAIKGIEVKKR